jgi:hypothetical protein
LKESHSTLMDWIGDIDRKDNLSIKKGEKKKRNRKNKEEMRRI